MGEQGPVASRRPVRQASVATLTFAKVDTKHTPGPHCRLIIEAHVKSHEVVAAAVAEKGPKEVASAMGVSLSLIYKWSEGKTANPLERALELIQATGSSAPLSWMCTQMGGSYLPRPDPAHVDETRLVAETQRMLKEFSDVLQAMTSAFLDGHVSVDEAALIRREWEELLPIAEGLVRACEAHAKSPKK